MQLNKAHPKNMRFSFWIAGRQRTEWEGAAYHCYPAMQRTATTYTKANKTYTNYWDLYTYTHTFAKQHTLWKQSIIYINSYNPWQCRTQDWVGIDSNNTWKRSAAQHSPVRADTSLHIWLRPVCECLSSETYFSHLHNNICTTCS